MELTPPVINETKEFRVTDPSKPVRILLDPSDPTASTEPISVPSLLKRTSLLYPDHPALKYKDEESKEWKTITYKEYHERVEKMAKVFIRIGLSSHGVVAILASNSVQWFVAELAAIYAGGIFAGIYTTNSTESCQHILENSKAQIIVVDDKKQLQKIDEMKKKFPQLKVVFASTNVEIGYYNWNELEKMDTADVEDEYQKRASKIAVNECCGLVYTSGTTGMPKGVMLSHDNFTWDVIAMTGKLTELKPAEEVVISYLPLSHVAGQIIDVFLSITMAATVYFADRDALKGSIAKTVCDAKPTLFLGVPRVYEKLQEKMMSMGAQSWFLKRWIGSWAKHVTLQHHLDRMAGRSSWSIQASIAKALVMTRIRNAVGFERLKYLATGAAPMSIETKKYFLSIDMPVLDVYGMSESTGGHSITSPDSTRFDSSGQSMPGIKTKIINPNEEGHGEICIQGRHVFMGYLNDKETTKQAIDDEGWLRTGDIGYITDDGYIMITGRIKELIITAGGENIPYDLIQNLIKKECPSFSNVFLVGDKRKFLCVLIAMKTRMTADGAPLDELAPETINWLKASNLEHTKLSEIVDCPAVLQNIQKIIDRVNSKSISNAQKVQKFGILPNDFSVQTGELGPTMKVKRNYVLKKFNDTIEDLYKPTL